MTTEAILIVLDDLTLRVGGPARSVLGLHRSTNNLDKCQSFIITKHIDNYFHDEVKDDSGIISNGFFLSKILKLLTEDNLTVKKIILNEIWSFKLLLVLLLKLFFKFELCIFPRGALQKYSLKKKQSKKFLVLYVIGWIAILRRVDKFLVTYDQENSDLIALLGTKGSYSVLKTNNGMSEKELAFCKALRFRKVPKLPTEPLKFVYFSRIHENKGIYRLINAIASGNFSVRLHIYGMGDKLEINRLNHEVSNLSGVSYKGSLSGFERFRKLSQYDVFILPTDGENFGNVVLEALACGLFVVVSNKTPWSSKIHRNILTFEGPMDKNLLQLINRRYSGVFENPSDLDCVLQSYTWTSVAKAINGKV